MRQKLDNFIPLLDEYKNLPEFIRTNDLAKIKDLINKSKALASWQWERSVETFVRDALLAGKTDVVRVFLDNGFFVDAAIPENSSKRNAMPLVYYAAKSGNLDVVKLLIERGAKLESTHILSAYKANCWALHVAVKEGYADIVDYLLEKGASPHTISYDSNLGRIDIVTEAALLKDPHIYNSLIKHGARVGLLRTFNYYISPGESDDLAALQDDVLENYSFIMKRNMDHMLGTDLRSSPG